MMKKLILSCCLSVVLLATAIPALAVSPDTARLIADGRETALDVGALTIEINSENITATFAIDEASTEWRLDETHLYVGDGAPVKHSPGKFACKNEQLGGVSSDSLDILISEADTDGDGIVYIAAHAALVMQNGVDPDTGEPIYIYESAWAQVGENDLPIGKGKNWATCVEVDLIQ